MPLALTLSALSLEFRRFSQIYGENVDDPMITLLSEVYEWFARTIEIERIPTEMAHTLVEAFRVYPVATISPLEKNGRRPLVEDLVWFRLLLKMMEPDRQTVPLGLMLGVLARILDHGDLATLTKYRDVLTEDWFHRFMWTLDFPSWKAVRHFPYPVA